MNAISEVNTIISVSYNSYTRMRAHEYLLILCSANSIPGLAILKSVAVVFDINLDRPAFFLKLFRPKKIIIN